MIYVTGDTHCPIDMPKLNMKCFPQQKELTKNDYVIVLGDFGLLWKEDGTYGWWKKWFDSRNFTTLWLDGNHENHEWIDNLPVTTWHGGNVHKISDSIIHLMRGQVYEIEKKYFWVFGGALSTDKEVRQEGISWWPREEASYAEQLEGLHSLTGYYQSVFPNIDYILTHTCPDSIISEMFHVGLLPSVTGRYLDVIFNYVTGKEKGFPPIPVTAWYFGHWHQERYFRKDGINFYSLYNSVLKII